MEKAEVLIATPATLPIISEVNLVKTCPWGTFKAAEVVALSDVMSEQLAVSLDKENKEDIPEDTIYVDEMVGCGEEVTDCSDDFLLAKMLQLEFDKEHDNMLKRVETKFNSQSKVKISYGKYRRVMDDSLDSEEDSDDREFELDEHAREHWRNFEDAEKTFQSVGRSGVSRQGNTTTTKHDLTVSGRRNASKLMALSPGILTGDAGEFDMKISNNVFNTLRCHSVAEAKRRHKLHDKTEKSTADKALDERTHLILYKMVNNQILDSITGCFSTGKEACVYHAWSGLPPEESPSPEFALKVYKTTLNEFQNREEYMSGEHRFRHRFSKLNPQKIIHLWAEKEHKNLINIKKAGIPCPEVVNLKKHVLVMTFIGKDTVAALKIKDVELPFADMTIMYEQVIEIMKTLFSVCKLVHADFSEYNLLWHEGKVHVIDVSQSVDITHPRAMEFLLRDCTNISTFFQKKGVLNVPKPQDLFYEICEQLPKPTESIPEPQ